MNTILSEQQIPFTGGTSDATSQINERMRVGTNRRDERARKHVAKQTVTEASAVQTQTLRSTPRTF